MAAEQKAVGSTVMQEKDQESQDRKTGLLEKTARDLEGHSVRAQREGASDQTDLEGHSVRTTTGLADHSVRTAKDQENRSEKVSTDREDHLVKITKGHADPLEKTTTGQEGHSERVMKEEVLETEDQEVSRIPQERASTRKISTISATRTKAESTR